MLGVQLPDILSGEVPHPQRLELDVERARRPKPVWVTTAGDLIVAHVAQPTQRHRSGKPIRSLVEPGPQLAQHADQTRTAQRVNLIEKQHQRPRADPRPPRERLREHVLVRGRRPRRRPQLCRQGDLGPASHRAEYAALRRAVVVAGSLADLTRKMQRRVHAASGQRVRKSPQRSRLPRLPRSMHHKIAHLIHQTGRFGQPRQRRNHVVVRGQTRPRRVEPASHELEPSATSDDDRPRHSTVHHVSHRVPCVPRRVPCQALRTQTRPSGYGDSVTVAASIVRNPWCMLDLAGQRPFSVRFGWAAQDLAALAHPSNVIVIVDVLRFTTAVSVAVGRGAVVLPFRHRDVAAQLGADPVVQDGHLERPVIGTRRRGAGARSLIHAPIAGRS